MTNVLVDTNCFVSIIDATDKWNKTSVDIYTSLQKYKVNLIVTDVVLNEAINVICKRLENKGLTSQIEFFLKLIEKHYSTDEVVWISEDIREYHPQIIKFISIYKGLLNYNDCFLLAYMLKSKIINIISFDNDFDGIEGLNRISSKTFELK